MTSGPKWCCLAASNSLATAAPSGNRTNLADTFLHIILNILQTPTRLSWDPNAGEASQAKSEEHAQLQEIEQGQRSGAFTLQHQRAQFAQPTAKLLLCESSWWVQLSVCAADRLQGLKSRAESHAWFELSGVHHVWGGRWAESVRHACSHPSSMVPKFGELDMRYCPIAWQKDSH